MQRARKLFDVSKQLWRRAGKNDAAGLAGEIAFRSFLELFPVFIFLAGLGGILQTVLHIQNPAHQMLDMLEQSLPQGAADPIRAQLEAVLGSQQSNFLGLPILGVLWLAAGSGATLLKAMNRIYGIEESRPMWERYLVGLWLTVLGGSVLVLAVGIMTVGQLLGQQAGGDDAPAWFWALAGYLRWPILVVILMVEAGVVYRVAPDALPPWRFVTPGAALFVGGWLAASGLFGVYVDKSGGYAATYGVLGGVIVLMLWLQLTAYVLLLGAELNGLLEEPSAERASATPAIRAERALVESGADGQVTSTQPRSHHPP